MAQIPDSDNYVSARLSMECVFSGSQSPPLSIFIARLSIIGIRVWDPQKHVIIKIFLNFSKSEKAIALQSSRLNQRGQDLLEREPMHSAIPFLVLHTSVSASSL